MRSNSLNGCSLSVLRISSKEFDNHTVCQILHSLLCNCYLECGISTAANKESAT